MANDGNFPYVGNGAYCYANSTSMLLASIGEDISPSVIESLTGVGLSATIEKSGYLFLNNQRLEPDLGIMSALKLLGFEAEVYVSDEKDNLPLDQLKEALGKQAVIIGPLDMGYLVYNPNHPHMHGSDHFVLVYGFDGDKILLHDPAGFPHVFIDKENLKSSWQAEKISYRQGYFRYVTGMKRVESPSQEEMYARAITRFKDIYTQGEANTDKEKYKTGKDALLNTAERLRNNQVSEGEMMNFMYFVFQLGAKRALDFAKFFDYKDKDLADLKRKQAEILGKAHAYCVAKQLEGLATTLEELAEIEEQFKIALLKK